MVSQIFVCILCNQRYKRKAFFLRHVKTHEVSARVLMDELKRQAGQKIQDGVDEAQDEAEDTDAPKLYIEGTQVIIAFRCTFCKPSVTTYETLGEL